MTTNFPVPDVYGYLPASDKAAKTECIFVEFVRGAMSGWSWGDRILVLGYCRTLGDSLECSKRRTRPRSALSSWGTRWSGRRGGGRSARGRRRRCGLCRKRSRAALVKSVTPRAGVSGNSCGRGMRSKQGSIRTPGGQRTKWARWWTCVGLWTGGGEGRRGYGVRRRRIFVAKTPAGGGRRVVRQSRETCV